MSGRGGGGGAGGRGGLKGATWVQDDKVKLDAKPSDVFPQHPNLKRPHPTTDREKRQVKHFVTLQTRIHRGPLYTQPMKRDEHAPVKIFSEDQFNSRFTVDGKADKDPFTGVETYSQRMAGKTNTIPKLAGRPFDLNLFPEELWSTLEGKTGEKVKEHLNLAAQKQGLKLNGKKDISKEERIKAMMEKIHNLDDEEEEEEEVVEEAEEDSEFDDDSMGGDYDGEKYFDNGEEDMDGGDGGGGEEEY